VVVPDAGQVPHQPGDRVGLGVDAERQLLKREAVDDLVDHLTDPCQGVDKQLGTYHWRLLIRCKVLPSGSGGIVRSTARHGDRAVGRRSSDPKASDSRPAPVLAHETGSRAVGGDLLTRCGMAPSKADAWMQVDGLIQWLVSAGSGATCAAAAESMCRKRAFNWTSRERFPSTSTVGGDLGERLLAQRFPGFC
jgi:hypothetical protein